MVSLNSWSDFKRLSSCIHGYLLDLCSCFGEHALITCCQFWFDAQQAALDYKRGCGRKVKEPCKLVESTKKCGDYGPLLGACEKTSKEGIKENKSDSFLQKQFKQQEMYFYNRYWEIIIN